MEKMIHIESGVFTMGDLFGEGQDNESPVHQVSLSSYYLALYPLTVAQFRVFVDETGYGTSAESPANREEQDRILAKLMTSRDHSTEEMQTLIDQFLSFGGTFWWDSQKTNFDFDSLVNWKNSGFEQADDHPVVCVSWNDAAHYCNWLSRKDGLPVAYDVATGELLDGRGKNTLDTTAVKGYRLPTEAEWEYAAREKGKKVRFGNGQDIARASEMNFDASRGDLPYFEPGEFREKTIPIGSFAPNTLGLYDMSGNAWEWCSDYLGDYSSQPQTNPYQAKGRLRAARGGRWGGDANQLRVSKRYGWESNSRCNNAGFRIARSSQ